MTYVGAPMTDTAETPSGRATEFPPLGQAQADPYTRPLGAIDPSDAELFETDTMWGYFERLRKEDPVHYCVDSPFGPYWSVTRYDDIVTMEKDTETYSSDRSITLNDPEPDFPLSPGFIAMDGERHTRHRKTVQPVAAPRNLRNLEPVIRGRVQNMLDGLPIGETFDWVDKVSIELTTGMLATIFDFPWEDRRKLTYWSDMTTSSDQQLAEMGLAPGDRQRILMECLEYFTKLWRDRKNSAADDEIDFVTAMANAEATRDIDPEVAPLDYLGTLILLIVGGNDTTRNSVSGGVLALNENPAEYDKLRANPDLITSMANEVIRWQTPLAYMRRTATRDTELGGKNIKQGDKLAMWYVSANRDDAIFDRPNDFIIDRDKPKPHLSFGWGAHFCMGSRLAELQLRVLWEEILERFHMVEVVGDPVRVKSSFVKGYHELPVQLHPR